MPLIKPNSGENESDFISRCMSNPTMEAEYPDSEQRLGVCYSQFKEGKDMEDFFKLPVDHKTAVDTDIKEIIVSDRLGIKALYSLSRNKIIEYYFDKQKWNEESAIKWFNEHKSIDAQPEESAKKFFKQLEEKRLVYGVALVPWEIDLQGDIMTDDAVEEACHGFMAKFYKFVRKALEDGPDIGVMHELFGGMGEVRENYIAPVTFEMNGVTVQKGSWVLCTKASQAVWDKIKSGELVGYSIGYEGTRVPVDA